MWQWLGNARNHLNIKKSIRVSKNKLSLICLNAIVIKCPRMWKVKKLLILFKMIRKMFGIKIRKTRKLSTPTPIWIFSKGIFNVFESFFCFDWKTLVLFQRSCSSLWMMMPNSPSIFGIFMNLHLWIWARAIKEVFCHDVIFSVHFQPKSQSCPQEL